MITFPLDTVSIRRTRQQSSRGVITNHVIPLSIGDDGLHPVARMRKAFFEVSIRISVHYA